MIQEYLNKNIVKFAACPLFSMFIRWFALAYNIQLLLILLSIVTFIYKYMLQISSFLQFLLTVIKRIFFIFINYVLNYYII